MKTKHIILASLAAVLFSCQKEVEPADLNSVVLVNQIEMTYGDDIAAKVYTDGNGDRSYPMKVGESVSLSCDFSPAADQLTSPQIRWSSSNEKVATVDENGKVTAIAPGEAGITVQQYPFSVTAQSSLKVAVFETAVPATSIVIPIPEVELEDDGTPVVYEGEQVQLTVRVNPADATYRTAKWSVDDVSVASIDPIKGVITGLKTGTVTVTAAGVVDTDVKGTLKMYVMERITPQGVKLTAPDGPISISDGTYRIAYETYPAVSTKSAIVWTSSDESIATVSRGVVTLKKPGDVDIIATCPDGEGGGGFEPSSSVKLSIPAGYYHEHLENPDLWVVKTGGATKELRVSDKGENYLYIVPNKNNANTGRGDFGHGGLTYVSRAYPIITFRVDDVNDRMDENGKGKFARNINLDTSGTTEDGTKYSGNVGGSNNKWYKKIPCADGSSILVYDLSTQSFGTGGIFPENTMGTFGTWQIKYADIRNSDKADIQDIHNMSYRFFWFHTFTSMAEFNAYLESWYAQYGVDYEGNPATAVPDAGVKFAKNTDVASIADATYTVSYETSPAGTPLTWTSSNEEVATVADGVVTLKGVYGSTTIKATVAVDGNAPAGYAREATLELTVPVGFYQDHMQNADLWKVATGGAVTEVKTSNKNEQYLNIVPNKANANTGRGDIKRQVETVITRDYPVITFRVDDVNDIADEVGGKFSRNINLDTSGKGDDGKDYKGNVGGDNNKWAKKFKCSDGSAILVYDLSSQNFKTGGQLPEGVTATFTTWQIKYADIRNSDKSDIQDITHMTYRFFWFHTFRSQDEMNAYLAAWSAQTGITYE